MPWAPLFLIKQAIRLGARIRAGGISPMGLNRMRSAGMVRPPQIMTAGLERGNVNLKNRFGISEIPTLADKAPNERQIPFHAGNLNPNEEQAAAINLYPQQLHSITAAQRVFGNRVIAGVPASDAFRQMGAVNHQPTPSNNTQREIEALFRRHEIDEQRIGGPIATKPTFFSHQSPEVIAREGQNLSGLSPETQSYMRSVRSGREIGQPPANMAKRYGNAPMGAYAQPTPFEQNERTQAVQDVRTQFQSLKQKHDAQWGQNPFAQRMASLYGPQWERGMGAELAELHGPDWKQKAIAGQLKL